MFDIILFAVISVFLFVKLKSILGQESDDQPLQRQANNRMKDVTRTINSEASYHQKRDFVDKGHVLEQYVTPAKYLFSSIQMSSGDFLDTCSKVVEIMLDSYSKKDKEAIKELACGSAEEMLTAGIQKDEEEGVDKFCILVKIHKAIISDLSVGVKESKVSVTFDIEQINYTQNKEGVLISGDKIRSSKITETWVFIKSSGLHNNRWLVADIKAN